MKRATPLLATALLVAAPLGGSAATVRKEPPRLTYVIEGHGICLAGPRAAKDVRLTPRRSNGQPSWSPDGRRFAFVSSGFLFVQDARGRGHPIAGDETHQDGAPAWSPNGRRIVFTAGAHGARLMTIRPDGTGVRTLTQGQFDLYPAWSPDGALIAFAREDPIAHDVSVYIIDSAGQGRRRLVSNATEPSWSPDGTSIVFVRQSPRGSDLVIIAADGTGERTLTVEAGYNEQPSWSPGGGWIAFTRQAPHRRDTDIALVRPDGTGMHVVRGSRAFESDPTWRPSAPRRPGKGPCTP